MKRFSVVFVMLFWLSSCTSSFTPLEMDIIDRGVGVMRVWKTDNRGDSLFLRSKARLLSGHDLESAAFRKLKHRMLATVNDTTDPGVGIAAPQVGVGRALIAVQRFDKPGEPFEFYINPKIEHYSDEQVLKPEGCLSVPDQIDSVWRSAEITVSYIPDPDWKKDEQPGLKLNLGMHYERDLRRATETIKGFTAVIFQHETDHLNGILFIDRVK